MPFRSLEKGLDIQNRAYHERDKELKYLKTFPSPPASRPVDFIHIIRTGPVFNELKDPTDLRLCDGIATILFKHDEEVLSDVTEVFFLRKERNTSRDDVQTWKNERTVTVSGVMA